MFNIRFRFNIELLMHLNIFIITHNKDKMIIKNINTWEY